MTDPEQLFEAMVDEGVLTVDSNDTVTTTEAFDEIREPYHDSYDNVPETEYHRALADAFALDGPDEAAQAIDELGITREQFVIYLALAAFLDGQYSRDDRARMATAIAETEPRSAVPVAVEEIDDDTFEAFLATNPDAILTVWRQNCGPCEAMKEVLGDVLPGVPDGVAVGGIEPTAPSAFRRTHRVDIAPAVLLFSAGEEVERFTGRTDPETIVDAFETIYG